MINNVELFFNDKNEYVGFAGQVKVKNKDVFVDTRTGKGYDVVVSYLNSMVGFLASRFNFDGFSLEDNKQHIMLRMLESIPKFNPNKDVQLSTFLQMRISRLLINEMRDANRFYKSATTLDVKTYSYRCPCGNLIKASKHDKIENCASCGLPIDKSKRHWIRKSTISLEALSDGYLSSCYDTEDSDKKIAELDMMSCIKDEAEDVRKIVCMLYFDGDSVQEIAKKFGITTQCVYNRLKKLRKNRKLRDLIRGDNNVYAK